MMIIIIIIFIHKFTPAWLFASFVCVSARGFKPITKVDTHDSRRPYYVANKHTHKSRVLFLSLWNTRKRCTYGFSLWKNNFKKNGGQKQKKNVIHTTTRRKALRFRKKKPFFSSSSSSAAKTTGWIKAAGWPRSDLLRDCSTGSVLCAGVVVSLVSIFLAAGTIIIIFPFARFYFLFSWTTVRFCGGEAISSFLKIKTHPRDEFTFLLQHRGNFFFQITRWIDRPL